MAKVNVLSNARKEKKDEFYTLWPFIEKEVQAYIEYNPDVFRNKTILCPCDDPEWSNFTKYFALHFKEYGIKKLISTSYSYQRKKEKYNTNYKLSLFEKEDPKFDESKTKIKGKIFILDNKDINNDGIINIDDLRWDYLEDDGDFRSNEVGRLRDEADIIITNPPFSLFREFLQWINEKEKKFLIISNINNITYKEVFPLIKNNKIWLGATGNGVDMVFAVPEGTEVAIKDKEKAERMGYIGNYTRQGNACWITNLDHGRRHQEIPLMTAEDNFRYSKHKEIKEEKKYKKYDNYDAIEIKYSDAIPSDYNGIMGVSPTFLGRYSPDQFEIIGTTANGLVPEELKIGNYNSWNNPFIDGEPIYQRILIKNKRGDKK